jgi:hypothetical protein
MNIEYNDEKMNKKNDAEKQIINRIDDIKMQIIHIDWKIFIK